jgi:hypothetical protein
MQALQSATVHLGGFRTAGHAATALRTAGMPESPARHAQCSAYRRLAVAPRRARPNPVPASFATFLADSIQRSSVRCGAPVTGPAQDA